MPTTLRREVGGDSLDDNLLAAVEREGREAASGEVKLQSAGEEGNGRPVPEAAPLIARWTRGCFNDAIEVIPRVLEEASMTLGASTTIEHCTTLVLALSKLKVGVASPTRLL